MTQEPLRWGFAHHTDLATLADGRRVVVKRFDGAGATTELERALVLGQWLGAAGIPTPAVLAVDAAAAPPVLVFEFIEGTTGADWLDEPARARIVGRAMGELAVRIQSIPPDAGIAAMAGGDPWADPVQLGGVAEGWLDQMRSRMAEASVRGVRAAIEHLSAAGPTAAPVVAHGDFVPVNVLVRADGGLAAVLDLGSWRLAHPWLDVAWWGWTVRAYHPDAWVAAWSPFLEAAGVPDDGNRRTIRSLQLVALLERAVVADAEPAWLERLTTAERWR